MTERVKIFLNNGYKYSGSRREAEPGFIAIFDDKDRKVIQFPLSAIVSMEELE